MSSSNPALDRLPPKTRWDRILSRLRRSRIDARTMRDINMPSDTRAQATRRYTEAVDRIIADLHALDELRALDDVRDLLSLTYGDA